MVVEMLIGDRVAGTGDGHHGSEANEVGSAVDRQPHPASVAGIKVRL